jgi:hypothetical protein
MMNVIPARGQPFAADKPMVNKKSIPKTKRYNLVLPDELYGELQNLADRRSLSVIDVMRKFIQIGMIVDKASTMPNTKILIRENNVDREIVIV